MYVFVGEDECYTNFLYKVYIKIYKPFVGTKIRNILSVEHDAVLN